MENLGALTLQIWETLRTRGLLPPISLEHRFLLRERDSNRERDWDLCVCVCGLQAKDNPYSWVVC